VKQLCCQFGLPGSAGGWSPFWSPDSRFIAFVADGKLKKSDIAGALVVPLCDGPTSLRVKAGAGTAPTLSALPRLRLLLYPASSQTAPSDWSRDGRFLIFSMLGSNNQNDIWVLPLTGDCKPLPFIQTSASEAFGRLRRTGAGWLTSATKPEVFVTAFPGRGGKRQIFSQGGSIPVWSHNGKGLLYISPDGKMMAVDVRAAPASSMARPSLCSTSPSWRQPVSM
jgi:Tol biopolymer transport system component